MLFKVIIGLAVAVVVAVSCSDDDSESVSYTNEESHEEVTEEEKSEEVRSYEPAEDKLVNINYTGNVINEYDCNVQGIIKSITIDSGLITTSGIYDDVTYRNTTGMVIYAVNKKGILFSLNPINNGYSKYNNAMNDELTNDLNADEIELNSTDTETNTLLVEYIMSESNSNLINAQSEVTTLVITPLDFSDNSVCDLVDIELLLTTSYVTACDLANEAKSNSASAHRLPNASSSVIVSTDDITAAMVEEVKLPNTRSLAEEVRFRRGNFGSVLGRLNGKVKLPVVDELTSLNNDLLSDNVTVKHETNKAEFTNDKFLKVTVDDVDEINECNKDVNTALDELNNEVYMANVVKDRVLHYSELIPGIQYYT